MGDALHELYPKTKMPKPPAVPRQNWHEAGCDFTTRPKTLPPATNGPIAVVLLVKQHVIVTHRLVGVIDHLLVVDPPLRVVFIVNSDFDGNTTATINRLRMDYVCRFSYAVVTPPYDLALIYGVAEMKSDPLFADV
jgi:hypothetical protein